MSLGIGYLVGMSGVVAFGSVIPVLPTGAAVSIAASLARHQDPVVLITVVIALGAIGAYLGDILTYAFLAGAGQPLVQRIGWLRKATDGVTFDRIRDAVQEHELRTLLVSRLIPGGRIPVLAAAALSGYTWRRFALADIAAATLWSVVYAGIGLLGRAIFPKPWESAVAALGLVVLVTALGGVWQSWRRARIENLAASSHARQAE
jgi:membrane protein DedA with SNARE-associated domain